MAALAEQISEFGFGAGLSEKEDAWLSSSGLGTLHNCVQEKTGALVKLTGYAAYPSAVRNGDSSSNLGVTGLLIDVPVTNISNNPKLVKRGDQLGAASRALFFAKADKWTLQGRVSPWVCEQRTVCQADGKRFDCCCVGNWIYTAHELSSGGVRVVATYAPTNETVTLFGGANIPTSGLTEPRIVGVDAATGTAVLLYMSGAQGKYHVVTPDGIGVSANITLATGYDAIGDAGTHQIWVAYFSSSLVTSDNYTFASGALSAHATTNQAVNNCVACSLTADVTTNRFALCWVEYLSAGGGNFNMAVRALSRSVDFSTSLWTARSIWQQATAEPITAGHAIQNLGVALSPADGHFVAFTDAQNSRVVGHWVSTSGVVEGGGTPAGLGDVIAPQTWLRSRPAWDVTNQIMFCLVDAGYLSPNERRGHLVLGIEPRSSAGKGLPLPERFGVLGCFSYLTAGAAVLTGSPGSADTTRISRPFQDPDGNWHLQSFELNGASFAATILQAVRDYKLVSDDRVGCFVELGAATYITGAVLSQWDGTRVCEATFCFDPVKPSLTTLGSGGLAAGTYEYIVTYARMTASGEIVRSRPSLSAKVTLGSTGGVGISIPHPGPSSLVNQDTSTVIYAEIWRAEVGQAAPLYFATRVFFDLSQSAPATFNDIITSYLGNEQLYSDGTNGEIANTPAPSPLSVCEWRNRLWATDGDQIFYTKEAATVRGAEWSQAFFVMSRGAPERLAALAPLGEVLMAFADDSTSYVYGDGPGADGSGSTLTGPMPVVSELGCTQPAGIAQLPGALLVPTRRGLHFLNGQRQFSYAGAAIEDVLAQFPRVRCARLISGTNRVWICLAAQDLSDGIAVIYDTHHGTWSTAFSANDSIGGNQIQCSTIDLNGVHTWSNKGGNVYDQVATYELDTSRYGMQIETPWFKANGPSGEIRARRFIMLMKNLGTSALQIEIAYDFSDTYKYSITVLNADLAAMEGNPDTLKPRIPYPRQRCQSYRMRFTEVAPVAASSPGFRFVSLRMATSLRPGTGKLLSKANSPAAFTEH